MPIQLIDNFKVNSKIPIDDRLTASSSTERDAIVYKYDGLKVFVQSDRKTYVWNNINSTWDIDSGDIEIEGTENYIQKIDQGGIGLTNSSIISYPTQFNEISQKVGIGGNPYEAFQINGNYASSVFGTYSLPFVIHKGSSTIIGENWYWQVGLGNKSFYPNYASSTIEFKDGGITLRGRTAGSTESSISTILSANYDGSLTFYNGTTGSTANGTIAFVSDKLKVKEGNKWKNISNGHKVWISAISQSSNGAPTGSVLESEIGSGYWSYVNIGQYYLNITGGFVGTVPSISGFCGPYTSTAIYFGQKVSDDVYEIRTISTLGGSVTNDVLNSTLIEIKIWE